MLFYPSAAIGQLEESESEEEEDDDEFQESVGKKASGASGGFWSSLNRLVGQKSLDRADIAPVIAKMQDHLISKNVAADVAAKLCASVESNLEGKVLGELSTRLFSVRENTACRTACLVWPKE